MIHRVMSRQERRGFTLIELLVVITIIAILATISVPAVMRAIQMANRIKSSAHLTNIGQAAWNYASTAHRFPPGRSGSNTFYVTLKDEMDLGFIQPGQAVSEFLDPARGSATTVSGPYAHYGYDSAPTSLFGSPKGVPFGNISSARYTLMLGIMGMNPQDYLTSGEDWATGNFGISASSGVQKDDESSGGGGFGSPYSTGAPFLYADRTVRLIRYEITPTTFQALWQVQKPAGAVNTDELD